MRNFLVAGNWKMNGSSSFAAELVDTILSSTSDLRKIDILLCPPYPYLGNISRQIANTGIQIGAQNVSQHKSGAYTGEIAVSMLKDFGCNYVILGHSERRAYMNETNEIVAEKFLSVVSEDIKPILCIGETLEEREADDTKNVIQKQLASVIDYVGIDAFSKAIIAYEPIWAIGTGFSASPEQAQEVHHYIRSMFTAESKEIADNLQILYGGSMNGGNASGLLSMQDIDGGLIGGASIDALEFVSIIEAAILEI